MLQFDLLLRLQLPVIRESVRHNAPRGCEEEFASCFCTLPENLHYVNCMGFGIKFDVLQVTYMAKEFDLSYPIYRATALAIAVNAYRLWVTLSCLLPDLAWRRSRLSLFEPVQRPNG